MHKSSHTIAAVTATTGEMLADKTAAVGARGFDQVLQWARTVGRERVWAVEDCRHVSGSFERFLIGRGERVVRVATRLMANSRRSSRERGTSDRIDALAVARAALAEGIATLASAELAGPELDVRLLVDHRERLVRARCGLNSTLRWHLHDLWPGLELPGRGRPTFCVSALDKYNSDCGGVMCECQITLSGSRSPKWIAKAASAVLQL
jgi:transposase